jgi:hypothetical protein
MIHLTETRERFFRAIIKEVPVEQIAEIHFFQPMRQGGVESGVAVVASRLSSPIPHPTSIEVDENGGSSDEERERYTVYTARYRHTIKGPERGKWEASIVPEADAPLVTVGAVVRGVQRRSGDADEVDRMTGDEARELSEQLARSSVPIKA